MRFISFILAVLLATFASFGLDCTDSVNVRFRVGSRYFDSSLGNNRELMNGFVKTVREASANGDIERIVVYGFASPEGKQKANERLARNRCATIARYIINHTGVTPALIEKRPEGVGWDELRRLVAENPDVPYREKVLEILDNTPLQVLDAHGRVIDGRKKQLMNLAGGRAWRWLYVNIFPEVRNAVAISLYCRPARKEEEKEEECTSVDTACTTEECVAVEEAPDAVAEAMTETPFDTVAVAEKLAFGGELVPPRYRFALKTNLLYYPILLPNLELEWLINDRWSVAVEGNMAWWGSYKKERSYRLVLLDAEARHWIIPRAPWHGMYAGVIAGGGWYDLEKGTPGKYGEGLMTGLSFGYMWPIGRRLSLEAEIGAGYAYTRYREYQPYEGHHLYLRTKELHYFGPIKLKFSLVWRFFDVNNSKRKAAK